ncbi:Bpu10I family restriction endonuclease [Endomicrobium proavitum]|uniref:Bpu10I family restriction endonuclease n=1 Tax=Endomicrobium proavitum TaxID=1408281 RepID=A0A0G3WIL1_9BACT|nr:Bpu10I family restriction endonuclease [Endomicrobium proavitum]AKL98476.1 hypothetical protein Epro_1097 [Endomicrobium proavitum]
MQIQEELKKIIEKEKINLSEYRHASNFIAKYRQYAKLNPVQKKALDNLLPQYLNFLLKNLELKGYSKKIIEERTQLLNQYFDFMTENGYDNTFTSQGKFRPTIMEEFMYLLFKDLFLDIKKDLKDQHNLINLGGVKAYTNLYFSAKNLKQFVENPIIGINNKNQDFAIYRPIDLKINNESVQKINLPIIAIENKTYIDKTMLEGSIATAEKIKSGNPYSLFFIVTETYEVDSSVDPAYSRIDQIFVLRKSKNKDDGNKIFPEVVFSIVKEVKEHLDRNWSNIEEKLKMNGKII